MSVTSVGEIGLDLVVNQNKFNKQMAGIHSLAKKAGAALAAAFAVKKVVDFGKKCLELGSDLEEVQNVVDVTFPRMTAQVDKFAKSAAQSFGLSETMAKRYTGTFGAMAKAFGFSEKAAYDMGTTLTGLAGDVASFYNISQDEAYTKLKSVFTGETESLKDLGVVMTQSALDAYALANGFGKTTQAMSEAEKVALRYQFVQNQLSAAQGDFARTSGSWANQVKILKLQFDSLKATIGQGLINLFTPVIKVVNSLIGKLATLANAFKSFTELITGNKSSGAGTVSSAGEAAAAAGSGMESAAQSADNMADSTRKAGNAAKKAAKQMRTLMGFDQINRLDSQEETGDTGGTSSSGDSGLSGGDLGNAVDFGSLAQGETVIDKVDSKFQRMFLNIQKLCKPATQSLKRLWNEGLARLGKFTWTALKDFFEDFLVPVGKWTLGTGIPRFIDALNNGLMKVNFQKINDSLKKLWDILAPFAIHVGEGLLWFWENVLVPFGTWTANEIVPRFLDTLRIAIEGVNGIIVSLQPLFQWFWENVLQPVAEWTGGLFLSVWDGINGALQKFSDWCGEHQGTIQTIATIVASFFAAWKITEFVTAAAGFITTAVNIISSIKSIAGAVSLVKTGIAALTAGFNPLVIGIGLVIAAGVLLYQNWDVVKEKCAQLKEWVTEKVRTLKDSAVKAFNTLAENVTEAMKVLAESVKNKWEDATKLFQKFDNFLSGVFEKDWTKSFGVLGNIFNAFFKNLSNIWGDIKKIFNGIIDFVSGVFTGNWSKAWQGIREIFSGVFAGLADMAKSPLNAIIGAFNTVLSVVNSLISKINNIRFKITVPDWIPGIGGSWWGFNGFNIPSIGTIPYLAQGGFVEKNTPRLAMIGDNRHYGEIVAPENKLREMAMEAVRAAGAGGITRAEMEEIINNAVLRIVAALAGMGFYVDGERLATAMLTAAQSIDTRFNPVEVT